MVRGYWRQQVRDTFDQKKRSHFCDRIMNLLLTRSQTGVESCEILSFFLLWFFRRWELTALSIELKRLRMKFIMFSIVIENDISPGGRTPTVRESNEVRTLHVNL